MMRRFFVGSALGLLLAFSSILAAWWWLPDQSPPQHLQGLGSALQLPLSEGRPQPPERAAPVHILVMGVDQRGDDPGRSDTIFLVQAGGGQVRLLSLPRDTRVKIDGVGEAKLNAAYAYGGPKLAKETVSDLLGLPIDYYAKVDLKGFRAMVDLIGGVPYRVETPMHYEDPYDDLMIHLEPGEQVLDGHKAEQYVRFRYDASGDDISRIQRQQAFLKAAARHALQPANLPKLPTLLYTAGKHLETDLPFQEQLRLAKTTFQAQQSGNVTAETLPGEGAYVGDISYFLPHKMEMERLLQSWRGQAAAPSHVQPQQ